MLSGGGSTPTPNTPEGVGRHGRPLPGARRWRPALQHPADLRRRLRARPRQPARRDRLPAQHRPRRHPRPGAWCAQVEHITATETRATGPQWAFAPCVCVARDDRWGRTYESFGEDPALVEQMETAIDGLQGAPRPARRPRPRARHRQALRRRRRHRLRHRPTGDYTIDQGIDRSPAARTSGRLALAPYVPAVQKHDVGSVMPSYSSVDWTEDGLGNPVKMHAQPRADHRRAQGQAWASTAS